MRMLALAQRIICGNRERNYHECVIDDLFYLTPKTTGFQVAFGRALISQLAVVIAPGLLQGSTRDSHPGALFEASAGMPQVVVWLRVAG